jgi:Domain of unknown function (DUF4384)
VSTIETRPPRQSDDSIPDEFDQICTKALSKRPADRYSTALDMAKALRSAVAKQAVGERSAVRPWMLVGAAAAVAIGAFMFLRGRPTEEAKSVGASPASLAATAGSTSAAGSPTAPVAAPAPELNLEIHYQRKNETENFEILTDKDSPLANGDRVQVHVTTAKPQYYYVYWYDPAGESRRLWPEDPATQEKLTELALPSERDRWLWIEGSNGNEMVIAGAAEEPLDGKALAALETTPSFAKGTHALTAPLMLPITSVASAERGLGAGTVVSRKTPLDVKFEDLLKSDFVTYRGIVVPHE